MKKRILSLILALSMVLSVLPLGAFAADPLRELVMKDGLPDTADMTATTNPKGEVVYIGHNWSYNKNTETLTLYDSSKSYDFSSTQPQIPSATGEQSAPAVKCAIEIESYVTITGGTFGGGVFNSGTIAISAFTGGTFNGVVTNNAGGTISGGTFNATVTNNAGGTISKGTFKSSVENNALGTIAGGTFQSGCSVKNYGTIKDNGTFEGTVENSGTISGGTFQKTSGVKNEGNFEKSTISGGTFEGVVMNNGAKAIIENGTFNGEVQNSIEGTISGGAFSSTSTVQNYSGTISGGTFAGSVKNWDSGTISGGTFAAGLSKSDGHIFGGVFNGVIEVTTGAGVYHITVDEASPDAKIEKVNDVPAVWDPYVVVESGKTKEVTVTANTDIYSLNGQPIGTGNCKSSYDGSNKTIVKFTMPNRNVELGTGGLVMAGGYPVGSKNGTADCEGKDWTYSKIDNTSNPAGKLTLKKSGKYDFSYTYPQNTSKGAGAEPVACAVETQSGVEITGGTFNGTVTNHAGTISGGKFEGTVINSVSGKISDGTFNATVTNDINGEISGGTFNATVTNYSDGEISNGTFNGTVTNKGNIKNGTFKRRVTNDQRSIYGGTFAAGLSENHGYIYHGVFNGNTALTTKAHKVTVTNGSVLKVNDEAPRKEDGTEDTAWDLYAYEGTTMTITASTEIFSLNGRLLGEGDHVNGNKNTVKFTMPDDMPDNENVVLNGAITCTELVMENGYPKASNGGTIPCKGTGWEYSNGTLVLENVAHFDFSSTEPVKCAIQSGAHITGGTFEGTVTNKNHGGAISDGIFKGSVENSGAINGGIFAAGLSKNDGKVTGGIFNGKTGLTDAHHVTVTNGSVLKVNDEAPRKEDGTEDTAWDLYAYAGTTVTIIASTEIFSLNGRLLGEGDHVNGNKNTVQFTMPEEKVVLNGAITCTELVMEGGWPKASNEGKISCSGDDWEYAAKDTSNPKGKLTLTGGTFDFSLANPQDTTNKTPADSAVACAIESYATISGGTFTGKVDNKSTIEGGTFKNKVDNWGTIKSGTFAAGLSGDYSSIFGGVFNGKTGLTTKAHQVTVTNGSVLKVNGVDPRNADGTTGTAWDLYSYEGTTMTITADTEIYSLNGKLLGEGDHVNGNKNTVKFTMPDGPVVLNGAITSTDLVMENGWPKDSNNGTDKGTISCSGNGWSYDHITKTLTLTDGEYNFSSTEPVQCAILLDSENAKITGGTFEADVKNNNGGTISDGTFNGTVKNYGGTISSGTFKGTVQHWYGTISGGTFHEKVLNSHGEITGGTFAAGLSANNGAVTGGVFNGNTGLNGVTGLHSIKWDDDYSKANTNAKIEKVNGVSAEWDPYVVVTELTTATAKEVTITADTEIFSLNGQLLGADDRVNGDKKTVKFTMPDDMPDNENVVLNKAITCTDLVMEKGWPKDSNGGTIPCKGDGWQYIPNDPTNGDMLLLTGSNQTGGLYDFSTIGDGSAVECNVFVGKPTAITGGEFNGKVFNNSGILGGTFHGEVENRGPGTINDGTFKNSVENNGTIEKGTFNDAVKNNNTINDGTFNGKVENNGTIKDGTFHGKVENTASGTIEKGTFHDEVKNDGIINGGTFNGAVTSSGTVSESITGSGTLNGKPITKTEPEPEPEPNPEPQPEPTTYTVTVIGGTIDGKTSVSAKEKDTLTVVLDQNDIPDGMTFDMWSISSSKLSGDINVDYRAEAMTFKMPAEDVTIRAQYRSAEIIEDAAPSPLATAATIAVGGAAAGIVVWQGVSLGVDLYLANALPQGVPVPTDRRALALLLWETAGKPEVALPTLYGDIPAEEIELQKATRWAVQNGLMDAADKKDASFFDPDHYVTKMDVFGAWLRLKKLLGTT